MSLPKFTAEASLYNSSDHYQLHKRGVKSHRRRINAIHPAKAMEVGHEVIVIEDEAPGGVSGFPWGWGGGGHGGGSGGGDGDVHIGPRPRPRPDETKRVPKLCGTNEAKEESEFYKEASDCFEFNTLDWGKQQECLRLHGCPDDDRNRKQSSYCNDWCPRSKFFAPWSSKSWLQSCINTASAAANHLLAKANCVVPKVDTDAFMNDWWKSKQSPPTPPILAYEPREPTRPRFDPTRPRTVEQ